MAKVVSCKRRTSSVKQRLIRRRALALVGQIVVVRTFFGTFIGCLRSVGINTILLRVFSGVDRVFITIRIPIFNIFDIFRFPCP